jgi:aryl-alcohol dehydrogenase-like predicted oxidoreductase
MEYKMLGKSGLRVSALCLGTENFGPRTTEADALTIIDSALDAGINFMDTADIYGTDRPGDLPNKGRSEAIIGNALKRNGKRDSVFIATKVRDQMWVGTDGEGLSRAHILRAVEDSLRRLQTDHIDLYQLHWEDDDTPLEETVRVMDELVRSGKVRYIGTSNFAAWRIMEMRAICERYGFHRFISEQIIYNAAYRAPERELFPMALAHGVGIMVWSPLMAGMLSGTYRRGQPLPPESRFADDESERKWPRRFLGEQAYRLVDVLETVAQEKGHTIPQVAIAWILAQPAVSSVIVGPRTMAHLTEVLGAPGVEISDEDRQRIDTVVKPRAIVQAD